MISLSALVLFPMPYLKSFAFAGVAVVGLAAISSIIVLPAILAVLGRRVEKGRVFKVKPGQRSVLARPGRSASCDTRSCTPSARASCCCCSRSRSCGSASVSPTTASCPSARSSRARRRRSLRENFASREADGTPGLGADARHHRGRRRDRLVRTRSSLRCPAPRASMRRPAPTVWSPTPSSRKCSAAPRRRAPRRQALHRPRGLRG